MGLNIAWMAPPFHCVRYPPALFAVLFMVTVPLPTQALFVEVGAGPLSGCVSVVLASLPLW